MRLVRIALMADPAKPGMIRGAGGASLFGSRRTSPPLSSGIEIPEARHPERRRRQVVTPADAIAGGEQFACRARIRARV